MWDAVATLRFWRCRVGMGRPRSTSLVPVLALWVVRRKVDLGFFSSVVDLDVTVVWCAV